MILNGTLIKFNTFLFICLSTAASAQIEYATITEKEALLDIAYNSLTFDEHIESTFGIDPEEFRTINYHYLKSHLIGDLVRTDIDVDEIDDLVDLFYDGLTADNRSLKLEAPQESAPHVYQRIPGGPCVNMDFETGDVSGWRMFEGMVNTQVATITSVQEIFTPGNHHQIMTPGNDPVVGIPMTNPNGGQFSLRLGDGTGSGSRAASIRQTFMVTEENSAFSYSYAAVLQNPTNAATPHSPGQTPFFRVNVIDENNASIPCGQFTAVAGNTFGGGAWQPFTSSGTPGWFRNWSTVYVPLQIFIGQDVTIEIIAGDCEQSGHFGYAYFDAECASNNLIEPGTLICSNEPITLTAPPGAAAYNWSTGESTQSIETNEEGLFTVQIVPWQGTGCSAIMTAELIEGPSEPHAAFIPSKTTLCVGEEFTLLDSSYVIGISDIDSWYWDLDDGSTPQYEQDLTYAYNDVGVYDITMAIELWFEEFNGGCTDTTHRTIEVHPSPVAAFDNTTECFNFETGFTDLSTIDSGLITEWDWDFTTDGSIDHSLEDPLHRYFVAGEHIATLVVTSDLGCSDMISSPVTVHPEPTADFETEQLSATIYKPTYDFVNMSSLNDYNTWIFDGIGASDLENPSVTFPNEDEGIYEVCLEVETDFGCTNNICKNVKIDGISTFFIPNSFTPNGDGINDLFAPITFGADKDYYEFKIYNRWGDNVFFTDDISEKWNGSNGDYFCPDEMYTWQLKFKDKYTSEIQVKTGNVTLLR